MLTLTENILNEMTIGIDPGYRYSCSCVLDHASEKLEEGRLKTT